MQFPFETTTKDGRKATVLAAMPNGRLPAFNDSSEVELDSRTDIYDATDFIGWYMTETKRRNGVSKYDARNQYLAYHEGQGGYARGTHLQKSWLLRTANRVEARSDLYGKQLRACGKI